MPEHSDSGVWPTAAAAAEARGASVLRVRAARHYPRARGTTGTRNTAMGCTGRKPSDLGVVRYLGEFWSCVLRPAVRFSWALADAPPPPSRPHAQGAEFVSTTLPDHSRVRETMNWDRATIWAAATARGPCVLRAAVATVQHR
jgi:hypothetical protein